jgi:hypothetical protein
LEMQSPKQYRSVWLLGVAVVLSGCAATSQVATDFVTGPRLELPISIRIQPCVDRTGTQVTDLAAQATQEFVEQLSDSDEFTVASDGAYQLVCEVTDFLPGNAVKRWILPGWGATVGRVSAMVQEAHSGRIEVITEGVATIGSGGLYTIGARQYIVPVAVRDTVVRLQAWARGEDDSTSTTEGA